MMKAQYRFLLVVVALFLVGARAYRTGAPAFFTGAPGEQTCAACHTGNPVNDAFGSLVIEAPSSYVPGASIDLVIRAQRPGASRFGFEVTAFDAAGQPAGTFDVSGPGIQLAAGSSHHVTHDPAVDATESVEWTVPWQAPAAGSGPVTFYAAANAANRDFSPFGDFIYSAQQASIEAGGTHVDRGAAVPGSDWALHSVWPNPLTDGDLALRVDGAMGERLVVSVHDVQGRVVWSHAGWVAGASSEQLLEGTRSLAPGAYLVRVSVGSGMGSGYGSGSGAVSQTRMFTKLR